VAGRQGATGEAGRSPQVLAVAIIAAFLGWMAATWIGGAIGLPPGLALVLDVVCLGVLGWALVSLIGIWRTRRNEGR
jgi:hypothetical protein